MKDVKYNEEENNAYKSMTKWNPVFTSFSPFS